MSVKHQNSARVSYFLETAGPFEHSHVTDSDTWTVEIGRYPAGITLYIEDPKCARDLADALREVAEEMEAAALATKEQATQ